MNTTIKNQLKETSIIIAIVALILWAAMFGAMAANADNKTDKLMSTQSELELYKELKFSQEANEWKYQLLELQYEALEKADSIIRANNLYDTDGSDIMSEYLEIKAQIDSITSEEI